MAQNFDQSLLKVNISPRVKAGFAWTEAACANLKQIHSALGVRLVHEHLSESLEGDWLWTTRPNATLGIKVADCTAVLIYGVRKSQEEFVAALHAGWRGTANRIFQNFFDEVEPQEFTAWLSPRICQSHFEVGPEVLEELGLSAARFSKSGLGDRSYLDLGALQKLQLEELGARVISHPLCTYHQNEMFSFRRSGKLETGRHWAFIELMKADQIL